MKLLRSIFRFVNRVSERPVCARINRNVAAKIVLITITFIHSFVFQFSKHEEILKFRSITRTCYASAYFVILAYHSLKRRSSDYLRKHFVRTGYLIPKFTESFDTQIESSPSQAAYLIHAVFHFITTIRLLANLSLLFRCIKYTPLADLNDSIL